MGIDLIVEYVAGFSFGLFIFQSLFMKKMMGGTYWENVRKSFLPEFISMNAMMAGMAPTMSFLMMGRDMRAMDPTELVFWGVMSLGVMIPACIEACLVPMAGIDPSQEKRTKECTSVARNSHIPEMADSAWWRALEY
jgi:hypothetical protein